MTQVSTDAIAHEVDYPHPIDLVWKALTDADAITEWLMVVDGFKPEVGTKFTLSDPRAQGQGWSGKIDCEVLEVQEPTRFRYSWNSTDIPGFSTTVTYTLENADGGTKLRMEQSGFDNITEGKERFLAGADFGWGQKFLRENLPRVLDGLAANV